MNYRKLECFLAVAEELHYGKAADKLYMAQPPLSRAIKELESELQVKLFTRNSRRVELTASGVFLNQEAKKAFMHLDQIKTHLAQIKQGKTGRLKIAYVGAAMHSILPGILDSLRNAFDVHISLAELKNEEQVEAVSSGRIDLGFLRSVPERKKLVAKKVYTETFSLILPIDHPLSKKKKLDLSALRHEPYIALNYDCAPALCDSINEILRKSGLPARAAHETSQVNSIVRLVESGMGFSIVPTSVKKAYALNVKFIELKQFTERAYLFLLHRKEIDPFVRKCIDLITPS